MTHATETAATEGASAVLAAAAPVDTRWITECFGAAAGLVALVSPSGLVLATNRPRAAGAGRSLTDHFALESRADLRYALARVAETRQPACLDVIAPRADDSRGVHQLTVAPVLRDGAVQALTVIATDVTERRREEERLKRGEAMMVDTHGVAHLGTWEWDITQPHAVWSAELYRIYGLDPKSHVPTYENYLARVHPDDRQRVIDATNAVFHNLQPYSHDERIFRSDGTLRYLHTWAMPVTDPAGKLVCLLGVCQDITDRKLAEIALEAHAAELSRSNAELEQFARLASHDLQEPLRAVGSYVQLLAQRYRGQLDAAADEAIGFAVSGVHRMKALIEDLLEYSRITARPAEPIRVAPASVLAAALVPLRAELEACGGRVESGTLAPVMGDPAQLVSLFQHLVANAIKFRGPDALQVTVASQLRGTQVEFTVRDNGIGIGEQHFERIFVVFQRLNPEAPGTGIGLAVCRKIVERHGGRIWVESAPGRGSAFHFTLPAAVAAP